MCVCAGICVCAGVCCVCRCVVCVPVCVVLCVYVSVPYLDACISAVQHLFLLLGPPNIYLYSTVHGQVNLSRELSSGDLHPLEIISRGAHVRVHLHGTNFCGAGHVIKSMGMSMCGYGCGGQHGQAGRRSNRTCALTVLSSKDEPKTKLCGVYER